MSRGLLAVITGAVWTLSACGGSPSEPSEAPKDTSSFRQNRGRLIAYGVSATTNGFWDPGSLFLGNEREIAFGTGTGWVGEATLSVLDVEARTGGPILKCLNSVATLGYSSGEHRIYWGAFQQVISVDPDGSNVKTHTTDNEAFIQVSPNGRYLLHRRWSDRKTVLVDQVLDKTTETDLDLQVRLYDEFAVFPVSAGVGVWDLATNDTVLTTGIIADFVSQILDLGGSREAPRIIFIPRQDVGARVLTFIGDTATGSGTTRELLAIPGDSVFFAGGGCASEDGNRIAVIVVRGLVSGSGCTAKPISICRRWDILLIDLPTGTVRVVAQGISELWPMGIVLSPGGTRLLYHLDSSLYLVDLP